MRRSLLLPSAGCTCAVTFLLFSPALEAGVLDCDTPVVGPDLVTSDSFGAIINWGTIGGVSAYSWGTEVCNFGDQVEPFIAETNEHPVIATNLYRVKDGVFDHIGLSWVKHTFGALAGTSCCECDDPGTLDFLGVGCSDPYLSHQGGDQDGFSGITGIGPRSDVNPVTCAFDFPYTFQGLSGDALYKRLQVRNDDLNPALNPDARYFAETHYIGPQDSAAGNQDNNAAYREVIVTGADGDSFNLAFVGESTRGQSAIMAWQAVDPTVSIETFNVPDDGRFILGSRCENNGDGTWTYVYALYNMYSARAARAMSVLVPDSAVLDDVTFHGVQYHSGEPYSSDDWPSTVANGAVTWSTHTFAEDADANALRWGTVYTFTLTTNIAPGLSNVTVELFAPALEEGGLTLDSFTMSACGPGGLKTPADLNGDGSVGPVDLALLLGAWGRCAVPDDCPADFDGDGSVGPADLAQLLGAWS